VISLQLDRARQWTIFTKALCGYLSDYAMPVTVLSITALVQIPELKNLNASLLEVPDRLVTTSGRPWIVDPMDGIDAGLIFAAILPAIVVTVLIFFDHNVSSLLSQSPSMKLKKPAAYNYDFMIVGLCMVITGILGLPFTHGLIPQAPLHVVSLAKVKSKTSTVDGVSHVSTYVDYVVETRVSNFVMSVMIGLTAIIPELLRLLGAIPIAVLAGLFLYMGIGALSGNSFVQRTMLFIAQPGYRRLYYENTHKVPLKVVLKYTALQLVLVAVIFGITLTPAAISFPVLIGILVPLRYFIIGKVFSANHLKYLDSSASEPEEPIDDMVIIAEDSCRRSSDDSNHSESGKDASGNLTIVVS